MLIIGCGNRQRGDDGAGILVAERLRKLGIDAETRSGEAADLIAAWNGADDVILVDAVVSGAPLGTVQTWDARQFTASVSPPASTHGLGVAEAIQLARVLNQLPARLRVYAIEARRCDPGSEISPQVQGAVEEVVQRIISELGAAHQNDPLSPLKTTS